MESWQLKQLQSLSTEAKIIFSQRRIKQWYEHWEGQVYIAFSGGKDSTVLLHLVRLMYPEVPAVFVDTGLEFPEIRDFVKTVDNVVWLKPKMRFDEVLKKYGYPVVSKNAAGRVERIRATNNPKMKHLYMFGGKSLITGKEVSKATTLAKKHHYLLDAPFKISEKCCDVMKKTPLDKYAKDTKRKAIIGTMTCESSKREREYLKTGCNVFRNKNSQSKPLSIWSEQDIWNCLHAGIKYSKIYDMGYDRTGCIFCMFGCQMEKESRFERLAQTHPKLHAYCMTNLGLKEVLEFMDLPTGCDDQTEES